MDKNKIISKVQPIVNKISSNIYLNAISNALIGTFPLTIIGALFTLLSAIPFEGYQNFLNSSGLGQYFYIPILLTTHMISLYAVFLIAYNMAKSFNYNGAIAGVISLLCFFIVTPISVIEGYEYLSFQWLGAPGFFVAILVGVFVGRVYAFIRSKNIVIKMPNGVPTTIADSFAGLVPAIIIVSIFILISFGLPKTSYGSLHDLIYTFVQTPLESLGGSFTALLIAVIVTHALWIFGIHGTMVVISVMTPVWTSLDLANFAAYSSGQPIPNIVGCGFFLCYGLIGGAGATLGMNLFMSFKAKSKRYKTLGNLALPAGICGINEPLIFGTPIIMNPKLVIPFMTAPIVCTVIAYVATIFEIVPRLACMELPMGTPIVLAGMLQGSWKIGALQLLLIFVSFIIYLPFVRSLDNEAYKMEQQETEEEVDFSDIAFD